MRPDPPFVEKTVNTCPLAGPSPAPTGARAARAARALAAAMPSDWGVCGRHRTSSTPRRSASWNQRMGWRSASDDDARARPGRPAPPSRRTAARRRRAGGTRRARRAPRRRRAPSRSARTARAGRDGRSSAPRGSARDAGGARGCRSSGGAGGQGRGRPRLHVAALLTVIANESAVCRVLLWLVTASVGGIAPVGSPRRAPVAPQPRRSVRLQARQLPAALVRPDPGRRDRGRHLDDPARVRPPRASIPELVLPIAVAASSWGSWAPGSSTSSPTGSRSTRSRPERVHHLAGRPRDLRRRDRAACSEPRSRAGSCGCRSGWSPTAPPPASSSARRSGASPTTPTRSSTAIPAACRGRSGSTIRCRRTCPGGRSSRRSCTRRSGTWRCWPCCSGSPAAPATASGRGPSSRSTPPSTRSGGSRSSGSASTTPPTSSGSGWRSGCAGRRGPCGDRVRACSGGAAPRRGLAHPPRLAAGRTASADRARPAACRITATAAGERRSITVADRKSPGSDAASTGRPRRPTGSCRSPWARARPTTRHGAGRTPAPTAVHERCRLRPTGRRCPPRRRRAASRARAAPRVRRPQPSTDQAVERVLEVDEAALGVDPLGGLDRSQPDWHGVLEKEADQLAVGRVDLLADDHREARPLAELERPRDRVVVGDRDDVDTTARVGALVVAQAVAGVVRVEGVVVQVDEQLRPRRPGRPGASRARACSPGRTRPGAATCRPAPGRRRPETCALRLDEGRRDRDHARLDRRVAPCRWRPAATRPPRRRARLRPPWTASRARSSGLRRAWWRRRGTRPAGRGRCGRARAPPAAAM